MSLLKNTIFLSPGRNILLKIFVLLWMDVDYREMTSQASVEVGSKTPAR